MASADSSSTTRFSARPITLLRHHPEMFAAGLLLVALGLQAVLKSQSEWNDVYVDAGRRLLAGQDIYANGLAYLYPPFTALVAAPVSLVPPLLSRIVWFATSAYAILVMLITAWKLADGPPVREFRHWDRRELAAGGLGLACGMTYILNAFAHQQIDVVIGALVMTGCLRLLSGREIAGALWIGIAAACKATPLLFASYLLLRRRIVAGVLAGLVAVGINLLPDLVSAPPGGGWWLERWVVRYVVPTQQFGTPLGTWGSDLIYNQSLGGTAMRLLNTTLTTQAGQLAVAPRPLVGTQAVKLGVYLLLALLIGVSILASLRRRAAPSAASGRKPMVIELGLVVTLMLLMSPMSSIAHFGVLVLPGLTLSRHALTRRDWTIGFLVVAAAVLSIICNKDLVGGAAYTTLLWSGVITVATLLLWGGCVVALMRIGVKT